MKIFEIMEKVRIHLLLDERDFCQKLFISRSAYCNYKRQIRHPCFRVLKRLFEISEENNLKITKEIIFNTKNE